MNDLLNTFLAAGALLGGIAYAIGQLVSSRKRGQSDAMAIAIQEVEAIKLRSDRLEKELVSLQAEMHALRTENATLRELIVTRGDLDEKLVASIEDAVQKQTRRLVSVMREGAQNEVGP